MRVVFMGTPSFAVPSLKALAAGHEVVAVYTRPDAVSGRGSSLRPSAVKQAALELGLPVRQPKTLRDREEQDALASLAPYVVVVAAYGLILPREVLEVPPMGCVNVHASLLPRWRGAAPIQRAILAGDDVTGVSIMRMEEGLDTGPFCATVIVPVNDKSAEDLTAELAEEGARLLLAALDAIKGGTCEWQPQDESLVTYAEKIAKTDVALLPELTAPEAARRVRASSPRAPARANVDGRGLTVLEARLADTDVAASGVRVTKGGLVLGFAGGALEILRVKPDGKGAMDAGAWARGARLTEAATWRAS